MNKCEIFIILIMSVTFLQCSHNQEIHSEIVVKCALNNSVCLTQQAQSTLQSFVEGIPELGIQQIDKLHVDDIIVQTNDFSYGWINITVAGLRNAIIDNVRTINEDLKFIRVLLHTNIIMDFDYNCDGTALSLFYIFGEGKGTITQYDMQMEILFLYDIIKNDNEKDIMDLKKYYYGFDPVGGAHYNYTNIFNGDPKRSEILLNLMNDNWRIIVAKYNGFFNEKLSEKLFHVVKTYMRSWPLEELALY